MKQLTIAIPAYNAEAYIEKCLRSMVGLDGRLEIIVINDGSSDGTEAIAQEFVRRYPEDVRLISKENGGHGSGINTAIQHASGRYFKVVDADDWIVSENLPTFLDALEKSSADAVVTGYQTYNQTSEKILSYSCQCGCLGQDVPVERFLELYREFFSCCSFHGLCYRTEMYRQADICLSEGVFYEDNEYATLPFVAVKTVLILPLLFYVYRIGNANQSVAFSNQVKRIGQMELVLRRMMSFRRERGPFPPDLDEYFLSKAAVVAVSHFAAALVKNPDRKSGAADADRLKSWLAAEEPQLMRRVSKKYLILKIANRTSLSNVLCALYQKLQNSDPYKCFRNLWTY